MTSCTDTAYYAVLNEMLAGYDLHERLAWALDYYDRRLALVTSFGPSGIVLVDHLLKRDAGIDVITIDTNYLFAETYTLIDQVLGHYPQMKLQIHAPTITPQEQAVEFGSALWEKDPDLCCFMRKVVPLADALSGYRAWIAGIRRDQSPAREQTPFIRWDARHEMDKLTLMADWSEDAVWDYIRQHNLPYNALHDRAYPSIGCIYCTRAVDQGEGLRAGRWADTMKTECGLHMETLPNLRDRHKPQS